MLTLTSPMGGVLNIMSTRTTCMSLGPMRFFVALTDRQRSFRAIKNLVIDTTRVPPHIT